MSTLPKKELFRVSEAASYCEVSDKTIYRWIECGILMAKRIGPKRLRITRESLARVERKA